ncbi:SpvB/TcaC N-terminal domain-containing protein [Actinomadura vinacea]|uniref:SpvB/TcaC N-terminal domain-containing protein n=1 Tax=Actinomadura vinacea TaxID=115336 RepID=UPI0031DBF128
MQVPAVSPPKGGGAVRGLGEKFAADPATGTGSMSVPIVTSEARSGFHPELALSYDSANGNGPFGFGWRLSTPMITRRTDKGVPEYRDGDESDVYILSGAEDLVPVLRPDRTRFADADTAPGYVVHRYRPRTEGLFARIERWTHLDSGDVHWRSVTSDGVTTRYGTDHRSRVADGPRVFSWLACESFDDKGNALVYEYAEEDAGGVDLTRTSEQHRARGANRYLKRVRYGNRVSRLLEPDLSKAEWLFEAVFDYDEGHVEPLAPVPGVPDDEQHRFVRASPSARHAWSARPDPFSAYRAGFEVRTHRRCRRVLMFHHIPATATGEPGYDGLVSSTEFDYADLDRAVNVDEELAHQGSTRFGSLLRRVTHKGYARDDTRPVAVRDGVEFAAYLEQSLPPVEFEYTRPAIHDEMHDIDPATLPDGLDGRDHQWVDLHGEGISGVLVEQAGAWFYHRNTSPLSPRARFGRAEPVPLAPNTPLTGDSGAARFMDLAGDGRPDLVTLDGPLPGFHEHDDGEGWGPFRPFASRLDRDTGAANLRLVDLTGDGLADVLVTEDDALVWHPSLAEEGFLPARRVARPYDEEDSGPRVVFAEEGHSALLADMSGDGLTDLVRVRNGEVCYWPNLGHGRFGAKITMDGAPVFDSPEEFDERRVLLADLDGSGTTDIVYLHRDGVHLYLNRSGNGLSGPRRLDVPPPAHDFAMITPVDLLGNGTMCLVWSSRSPAGAGRPVRYVDLMGGVKPHLLTRAVNDLGAETTVRYVPSTVFYMADREAGRPWLTRLPFPVHVVERVEAFDRVSRLRFVTRYAYHHGDYDPVEREFRGFGMVEQWDTEHPLDPSPPAENEDDSSRVPPILTRSWTHTGVHVGPEHVSNAFAGLPDVGDPGEYYREPGLTDALRSGGQDGALLLDDTVLPDGLTVEEERQACRALRGSILRREVYALDGQGTTEYPYGHPYTVTEQNYAVRMLQPCAGNPHAVFLVHAREALTYQYERDPADPRIGHAVVLEVDDHGNERRSVTIGYGRRAPDPALPERVRDGQARMLATYAENDVTNAIDTPEAFRVPLPCASRTYELTGVAPAEGRRLTFDEIDAAARAAAPLAYEQAPTPGRCEKRLIDHVRGYFRRDSLTGPLPLGAVEPLALPYESYSLALTPGLVGAVHGDRVTDAMLADEARYVRLDGDDGWWAPSGRVFYSPGPADPPAAEAAHARAHFFLPHRFRDVFHTEEVSTEHFVTYDSHDLLVLETRDALGNRVTAGERGLDPALPPVRGANDYRVLQPTLVMDANRNRTAIAFDALGAVAGTAVMGKPEEVPVPGDRLTPEFRADLTQAEIDAVLADPTGAMAATLLGEASTRVVIDLTAYRRSAGPDGGVPTPTAVFAREEHVGAAETVPIQVELSYSDGFGREIQRKARAEPGPVPGAAQDADPRWVGTGWTVFDNKGNPIREYEPFFTGTHHFESDVRVGVSTLRFYDPLARTVATLHPDHTWEKVVFDPWRQETWDANDTMLVADPAADPDVGPHFARIASAEYLPTWYALRTDPAEAEAFATRYPDPVDRGHETRAAERTGVHAATPTVAHADSLGRTVATVVHNRFAYSNASAGAPAIEEFHRTEVVLDIENQQREAIDAKGRVVARFEYAVLGARIGRFSMEAGELRTLPDAAGNPCLVWDGDRRFRTVYDALRRPTGVLLREGEGAEVLIGRTVYGESRPDPEIGNLRGRAVEVHDQSGVVITDDCDFKGNVLSTKRRFARDYAGIIDVSADVPFEDETFIERTRYDALNRPVQLIAPHSDRPGTVVNVMQPLRNVAGLLEKVDVWLDQAAEPNELLDPATASLHAVTGIDYDAMGRRTLVDNGNGVRTIYAYDPLTFQLTHLLTRRDPAAFPEDCPDPAPTGWPGCQVRNVHYTYDPVGNTTHVRDDAQQTVFFRNRRVAPGSDFTYDAVYRLIEATGREHLGQTGGTPNAPTPHSSDDLARLRLQHPEDGNAMGRYLERYRYDVVDNIESMQHRGCDPAHAGWTRTYAYEEPSTLDPNEYSNRLTSTTVGGLTEPYGYDANGNLLCMPHLPVMEWDFDDQLRMTQRHSGNNGERTFHVYDSSGQRVRKVTESAPGQIKDERLYLGGFEIYRRHGSDPLERETLHVSDDEQTVAMVETRVAGDEPGVPRRRVRYQYGGQVGAGALELDEAAQVISYEECSPYGSTTYQAVSGQTVEPNRYRFTGKERDEESGLYYHGARYYAPWLGRWTACDPDEIANGPNLYVYALNNPLAFYDPSGAAPKEYEDQRKKDTAKKAREMERNRAAAKAQGKKPDPMQKTIDTYKKKKGRTPIDQHHNLGVKQAAEVKLNPKKMGKNMTSVYRPKTDTVKAGIGDRPHWDPEFKGKITSHHNAAKHIDFDEQAKGPETQKYKQEAARVSKERLPDTVDFTERPTKDWTREPGLAQKEPNLELKTGEVKSPKGKGPKGKGPKVKGPKGKVGGLVGKAIMIGVAGYVLLRTGDAYAALQTANPLANTTDAWREGDRSAGNLAWSLTKDAYDWTWAGTATSTAQLVFEPQGDNIYDQKLIDRALQEGRNPFCAQCHGPGGALDPNNEWNRKAESQSRVDLGPTSADAAAAYRWLGGR